MPTKKYKNFFFAFLHITVLFEGTFSLFFKDFLFSGHEPIYFTENKEKTLRVSYDRDTHYSLKIKNQGFSYNVCMMMEGRGSGPHPYK
jgi:hypothetical protein